MKPCSIRSGGPGFAGHRRVPKRSGHSHSGTQLRLQEDEIYRLRAALDQMQDCGSSCSERAIGGARSSSAESEDAASRRRRGAAAPNGDAAADGRAALAADDRTARPAENARRVVAPRRPRGARRSCRARRNRSRRGRMGRAIVPRDGRPTAPSRPTGRIRRSGVGTGHGANGSRSGRATLASQSASAVPVHAFGRQSAGGRGWS